MESLTIKSLKNTIENNTNLIQLDGCLPFLGCTIILSGPEMNELKIVKHALKKMLRLSRQLILENEYLEFLDLTPISTPKDKEDNAKQHNKSEKDQTTPFLHYKHM